jgi:hypothetical protein
VEVVFPDSQNVPAEAAEGAVDETVAGAVGVEFFAPEGAVVGGQVGVFFAGVPETAVHEKGDAGGAEHEVGPDNEFGGWGAGDYADDGVAPPAGDFGRANMGRMCQKDSYATWQS